MAKREKKTKEAELEIVDDIFMVEKNSRRLVGLKPDIKEAPENMVIPEGIEVIGKDAFLSKRFQHNNIKSIKFPDSLKEIEEIVLPESLRVIESQAFANCSKLKNIVFNEGLQVIEQSAFYVCKNLNNFVLPKSLRVVGDEALQYAKKVTIHGELPHNLMRAVSPISWTTHSEYTHRNWPMVVELVTDDNIYFLPKYIELANAADCECALNSGMPEKVQTMYKYCNSGDTSADTAYAAYMYLLESGQEPCEDLKKYVKRMSKSIASRLIATNRNAEAAKFIGLGLLTPAAIKSLYENAVNNGNNDIAAYLMEEMKKNNKKPSIKL